MTERAQALEQAQAAWVIRENRSRTFWKANACGYGPLADAGLYTEAEARQRASNLERQDSAHHISEFKREIEQFDRFRRFLSPVEPEPPNLSTLDRYRSTTQMDVDTWMVRAVASSEPRSEDDLVTLDHVIALLKPRVEPEPCVWRERLDEQLNRVWFPACCGGKVTSHPPTPFCGHCGAPLKVEREQPAASPAGPPAPLKPQVPNLMDALKKSLDSLKREREP